MMANKEKLLTAIKQAKEDSSERKFTQAIDLIINLKAHGKEKVEIEALATLPHAGTKQRKICALAGPELKVEAEKHCDKVILESQFNKYKKPKQFKSLRRGADFFIAQANIMPEVAKTFGKYFAPVGKMPNPKFGMIVPPKAKLGPLTAKLKNSVIARAKKIPVIAVRIGNEKMSDEELAENAVALIDSITAKLPRKEQNIRSIIVKTTMGKPIKIK